MVLFLNIKYIVGPGGRTLHKLESFVDVFTFVVDARGGPNTSLLDVLVLACLLAMFIIAMIMLGHYSIISSLARNGF